MKRTKNMVYKPTENADYLYLVMVNDGDLYRTTNQPICRTLAKHMRKGNFDEEAATKAFYPVAQEVARKTNAEFPEDYRNFTTADKWTAAADTVKHYMEYITELATE